MVGIISAAKRNPTMGQKLAGGLQQGLDTASQLYSEHQRKQAISKQFGEEIANLPPELQKLYVANSLGKQNQESKMASELASNQKTIRAIEKQRGLEEGSLSEFEGNPQLAASVTKPEKTEGGITAKEIPAHISKKIAEIVRANPNDSADELSLKLDEANIPTIYSQRYTENRRRTEEQGAKSKEEKLKNLRHETLPLRKEIADKSKAAIEGIRNKEHLLEIIERGDINDPTFAAILEAVPGNLGKRLLSNDTVEYKGGLVQEFGDLRNIFQGQTKIKEIDLLENKIADIYLTDDQKRAILKSRISALQADVIKGEVAQELENEPLGVLQFQQELEKRAKPRLEALFNRILDEQKFIIQDAENKKKMPLDSKDPEDKKIMDQIWKEAGGDKTKAKALAKKKGYTVKGSE